MGKCCRQNDVEKKTVALMDRIIMERIHPLSSIVFTGYLSIFDYPDLNPGIFYSLMRTIQKALNNKVSPYLVLLAGCGFLIALLSMVNYGVFFSGDGGLKYLITKQLDQSALNHIVSTHPAWVEETWKQGYYPFRPPFVYEVNNEHVITFPVFFVFLSTFFYRWFGYYGLYIVPALSVVLTWALFLSILTRLRIKTATTTLGLFLLIFCTPLTFYGAIFWEHSLATLLVFNACVYFISEKPKQLPALLSGLLTGMAIWFREETIILIALISIAIVWRNLRSVSKADLFFLVGIPFPILFYFMFNSFVFGSLFGLHGHQIIVESTVQTQLWKGVKQFVRLHLHQLIYFPFIIVFYFIIFFLWTKQQARSARLFKLCLIVLLFTLIIPIFLPSAGDKQWGPRFFLSIVPAVIMVLTIFADQHTWQGFLQRNKQWTIIISLMIAYSIYLNVYEAGKELHQDYSQRIYPALQYIRAQPCTNIIVDDQYVVQELTEQFNSKNFFLLEDESRLPNLLSKLRSAGQQQCIFVSMNKEQGAFRLLLKENKNIAWKQVGISYTIGILDISNEEVLRDYSDSSK